VGFRRIQAASATENVPSQPLGYGIRRRQLANQVPAIAPYTARGRSDQHFFMFFKGAGYRTETGDIEQKVAKSAKNAGEA
jgi:hypothetical protein